MKKTIIAIAALLITTATIAQNSLFTNVSITDQYEQFTSVYDEDGDGVYQSISNYGSLPTRVKFESNYLPTGEGYKFKVVVDEGQDKDKVLQHFDAIEGDYICGGYPYEATIKHKYSKDGLVSIGDYVFVISGISDDGTSFSAIDEAYIKVQKQAEVTIDETESTEDNDGKKKKVSFQKLTGALKNGYASSGSTADYGPAHKELQSENLDKLITDYLVTMKAKQDGRTSAEKQKDKNLEAAKQQEAEELKAYNDSIKATPEHQKMKEHQARMKRMENGTAAKLVTINNQTGKDIYIYQVGYKNGTRINVNSSTKADCSFSYTYKFDSNSGGSGTVFYNADSGCDSSITIN